MEKKKYPIGPEHYTLYEEIGQGVSASVYRALCNPLQEIVAIKILDFERDNCDLNNVSREAQTMVLVDHPNVLRSHCSFVDDHNLWVVMPFMAGGSCLHILKAAHTDGFGETVIATILREVLKGLEYLHHHGHIHRDVKAGNILVDSRGAIKLGDFGVCACLFDSGDRQRTRNTFVGTPCWMAPEVMEQTNGYDFRADIWSFGITALELANGHAPFSKYPPMKVLLMTLQNAPPGLESEKGKKFSKSFKQMIASCLVKDPSKRPSATKLLKRSFFKKARSNDYIARTLLEGLPALGDRMKALKMKEQDMLAQKKIPDGQMEEMSQNEYKRGISGWDFNLEDMKAQASLIQDEDLIPEKDQGEISGIDCDKNYQHQLSLASRYSTVSDTDDDDITQYRPSHVSAAIMSTLNESERSDDEANLSSLTRDRRVSRASSPCPADLFQQNLTGNPGLDDVARQACQRVGSLGNISSSDVCSIPNRESERLQTQLRSFSNGSEAFATQGTDDQSTGMLSKASKSSANSEELDDTVEPVVQQRGRFKVTSESVDLEKVSPTPLLQKSQSMQVLSHTSSLSLPSSLDATPPARAGPLLPILHSVMQTNMLQREAILTLMKQVSSDTSGEGGVPPDTVTVEKSLLEAVLERERGLLQEINDLQRRLLSAQEELLKCKSHNPQV